MMEPITGSVDIVEAGDGSGDKVVETREREAFLWIMRQLIYFFIVTPGEYVDAITFYAKQTIGSSLYPGYALFEDLALFLRENKDHKIDDFPARGGLRPHLANLFTLENNIMKRQALSDLRECMQLLKRGNSQQNAQILFLNGYPSPEWIAHAGSYCHVDPGFFSSHLRFRYRRDHFSSPWLPSANTNIITLEFITIGSREVKTKNSDSNQDYLDRLRADGVASLRSYQHELQVGSQFSPGDSIVRNFSVLDEKYFIIDQEISFCINRKGKKSWIGKMIVKTLRIFTKFLSSPCLQ
jgi:hypothetical protein